MRITKAIIPTKGLVVFPEENFILDIGRERSLEGLEYTMKYGDGLVFLTSQKNIELEEPTLEDLYEVGTICEIEHVEKKTNYTRVKVKGLYRAKLVKITERKTYDWVGEFEKLEDECDPVEIQKQSLECIDIITRLINFEMLDNKMKQSFESVIQNHDFQDGGNVLPAFFPAPTEFKQNLLEMSNLNERLKVLYEYIKQFEAAQKLDDKFNNKVRERMEESQKEYFLREKIRAIREELGDAPSENDADEFRKKVKENPYPDYVKEKALEEINRYESLPTSSAENGVVRNYIDWLINIPWWQESKDESDLNVIESKLDKEHYGLKKPKERILEYIAVKEMTNSLKAPIICLVGPPGVGKTSIAKSIAEALNRKFVKIALGGVKDEAEIRGHRRTYLGSMPGRFIQAMKKAGTINPVILIDEIDKMASDYKGDPASAMLEVLDPEQNQFFSDHYLEEPYDLSKVMFIATANYLENIPEALRDRLEIIELSSYTELEKLEIAKKHLIPKQLKENGLKEDQLVISDDILLSIIRYYTREAGVRQLERYISKLCRKAVLAILKDQDTALVIDRAKLIEYLGQPIFEYGRKECEDQVGVVTGLAYTNFGGDILQIEVNKFKGSGKLVLTGQLGDVMKESASIAYDYVKANAEKYHIDSKTFEEMDIHVHVPEGAVPKDGPSAGVTMTTAIVSALGNYKVDANVAMTGEVTLRGNVLPIGGLKEKSLAANRSGIKKIFIPEGNKKDIDDLADVVKENLKIVPVKQVDDILKEVLHD